MGKSREDKRKNHRNFIAMEMMQGENRKVSKRFDGRGNRRQKDARNTKNFWLDF